MKKYKNVVIILIIVIIISAFTLYLLNQGGLHQVDFDILATDLDRLFFEVIVNENTTQIASVRHVVWQRTAGTSVSEHIILERGPTEGPPVRHIILVHSYEEALQYRNTETLAVWPSNETVRALASFNVWLHFDIERYGMEAVIPSNLTFPITPEALVDNWEEVHALWRPIVLHMRTDIARAINETEGWEDGGEMRERAIALGVWPLETEE